MTDVCEAQCWSHDSHVISYLWLCRRQDSATTAAFHIILLLAWFTLYSPDKPNSSPHNATHVSAKYPAADPLLNHTDLYIASFGYPCNAAYAS